MKLEAKQRLAAAEQETLEISITASPDMLKRIVNLLGVIQWNSSVGHSATVGTFVDGDGADRITVDGLPDGDYRDMAEALSSYGDSYFAEVSENYAKAHNSCNALPPHVGDHLSDSQTVVTRSVVWPEES